MADFYSEVVLHHQLKGLGGTTNDVMYHNGTSWVPGNASTIRSAISAETAGTTATHAALTTTHGVSGAIVGTTDTQTLTNKSVEDSTFLICDNLDVTKKARFESSVITTGQTRVYTLPDTSGVLVLDTATQTLTNKTVTDATFFLQDDGDNTKKVQFQLSGITTATTRTLTIPDASGIIALSGHGHSYEDLNNLPTDVLLGRSTTGTGIAEALIIGSGLVMTDPTTFPAALGTIAVSFGVTGTTACVGNDSRLSDARTPTAHTHGNITNVGAIGSTSGLPIKTGASGVLEVGAFGTSSGQFAEGNHTHAQLHDAATIGASLSDIFSLTGQALGAVDPGADRLWFWDDSESKATLLSLGTGLSISTTTLNVSGFEASGAVSTHAALTATHGVSGDIVGTTDTQVLTNKTFTDSVTFFQDNSDNTKKFVFEAGTITTATTRTLTVPNASGTIALIGLAQTFTAAQTINANLTVRDTFTVDTDTFVVDHTNNTVGIGVAPSTDSRFRIRASADNTNLLVLERSGGTDVFTTYIDASGDPVTVIADSGGTPRVKLTGDVASVQQFTGAPVKIGGNYAVDWTSANLTVQCAENLSKDIISCRRGDNTEMFNIYLTSGGGGAFTLKNNSGSLTTLFDSGGHSYLTGGNFSVGHDGDFGGRLNIKASADNTNLLTFYRSNNTNIGALFADSTGDACMYLSDSAGAAKVQLNTAGVSYFIGGNVGFGSNASPGYAVDVTGDINLTGALRISGSAGTNTYVLTSNGTTCSWAAPTGAGITVQDEGGALATTATTLNFVGAGVTASGTGATKTITIAGGGYPIEIKSASFTAVNGERYATTAAATVTDPTSPAPVNGDSYTVTIQGGTATIGGVAYATAGQTIHRQYIGAAWVTRAPIKVEGSGVVVMGESNPTAIGVNTGPESFISGQGNHSNSGSHCSISGYYNFSNTGDYCSISGSSSYSNTGNYCQISGASNHTNTGSYCQISGSFNHTNTGNYCQISGTYNYSNSGIYCQISGYSNHTNSGTYCQISGSNNNTNSGTHCSISGYSNIGNFGTHSIIGGGSYTGTLIVISGVTATAVDNKINKVGHGLLNGDPLIFTTLTGGTGLSTATLYYVIASDADTFEVSTSKGGSAENITVDYSAVQYIAKSINYGNYCLISGQSNYSNTGTHCSISGANNYSNSGTHCSISGSNNYSNTGNYCQISGQNNYYNSGTYCQISGSNNYSNSGNYCQISGRNATNNTLDYARVHGGSEFSRIIDIVAKASTTDATPTTLTLGGAAEDGTNRINIPANSTWEFTAKIVARITASANAKKWVRSGLITNNAGSVTMSSLETIGTDITLGTLAASIAITADDTNDALKIVGTGVAATDIKWTAQVNITQVG